MSVEKMCFKSAVGDAEFYTAFWGWVDDHYYIVSAPHRCEPKIAETFNDAVKICIEMNNIAEDTVFPVPTWESDKGVYEMHTQETPSGESWVFTKNGKIIKDGKGNFIFRDWQSSCEAIISDYENS
jgi:hypothetical protein